jgi:hypothetical protein
MMKDHQNDEPCASYFVFGALCWLTIFLVVMGSSHLTFGGQVIAAALCGGLLALGGFLIGMGLGARS